MPKPRSGTAIDAHSDPFDNEDGAEKLGAAAVPAVSSALSSLRLNTKLPAADGCGCSRCLRKAGPLREDTQERIVTITHILADVYADTKDPDSLITEQHKAHARAFMRAVEANNVQSLEDQFLECEEGKHGEIVEQLIVSAAQLGHVDIIRCLSQHAADDGYLEQQEQTKSGRPLMFAAHNGHTPAVRLLLELGADPNAVDMHGHTALIICTFCDRAAAAEALCKDERTDVDFIGPRHCTALSFAAQYGSEGCLQVIAHAGADVFHEDEDGCDILTLAEQSGRPSTIELVKKLQLRAKLASRHEAKRLMRGGPGGAGGAAADALLSEEERARREWEAQAKMVELLRELEQEAEQAAAKKAKGKAKNKGKTKGQGGQQGEAPGTPSPSKEGVSHVNGSAAAHHAEPDQLPQQGVTGQQPASTAAGTAATAAAGKPPPAPPPAGAARSGSPAAAAASASGSTTKARSSSKGAGSSTRGRSSDRGGGGSSSAKGDAGAGGSAAERGRSTGRDSPAGAGTPAVNGEHGVIGGPSSSAAGAGVIVPAKTKEGLKQQWEALLEDASKCRDAGRQPGLLEAVTALMGPVAAAGISVKYGRKVLQRLEAVGPARSALQAALSAQPVRSTELEAAIKAARPAAVLLDPQLLVDAEAALEKARAAEEKAKWEALRAGLRGFDNQPATPSPEPHPATVAAPAAATAAAAAPPAAAASNPAAGPATAAAPPPALRPGFGVPAANGIHHAPVGAPAAAPLQQPGQQAHHHPQGLHFLQQPAATPAPPQHHYQQAPLLPPGLNFLGAYAAANRPQQQPPYSPLQPHAVHGNPHLASTLPQQHQAQQQQQQQRLSATALLQQQGLLPAFPLLGGLPGQSLFSGSTLPGVAGASGIWGSPAVLAPAPAGAVWSSTSANAAPGIPSGMPANTHNTGAAGAAPGHLLHHLHQQSVGLSTLAGQQFGVQGHGTLQVGIPPQAQAQAQQAANAVATAASPVAPAGGAGAVAAQAIAAAADGDDIDCVICMERERSVICVPCFHTVLCGKCADDVQAKSNKCPICSMPVEEMMRLQEGKGTEE